MKSEQDCEIGSTKNSLSFIQFIVTGLYEIRTRHLDWSCAIFHQFYVVYAQDVSLSHQSPVANELLVSFNCGRRFWIGSNRSPSKPQWHRQMTLWASSSRMDKRGFLTCLLFHLRDQKQEQCNHYQCHFQSQHTRVVTDNTSTCLNILSLLHPYCKLICSFASSKHSSFESPAQLNISPHHLYLPHPDNDTIYRTSDAERKYNNSNTIHIMRFSLFQCKIAERQYRISNNYTS